MRAYLLVLALGAGAAAFGAHRDSYKSFTAKKPVMPPGLLRLKPDMSEDEIRRALPTADSDCFIFAFRSGDLCVLPFWMSKRRHAVLFHSLSETRSQLQKRWGPPVIIGDYWYWVNPDAKPPLRAKLWSTDSPAQLHLEEYLPMRTLLGDGPRLGFEKQPIVGSTADALKANYGADCEADVCFIILPPSEVGSNQVVSIDMVGGKATSFSVGFPVAHDEARLEQALVILEKKWGARKLREGETADFDFEGRAEVRAHVSSGELTVIVGRR